MVHNNRCNNCKGLIGCPNKGWRVNISTQCPFEEYPVGSVIYMTWRSKLLLNPGLDVVPPEVVEKAQSKEKNRGGRPKSAKNAK